MSFKEDLRKLNEVDTYSLILFVLYKLRDISEYSCISELAYILDKDNLLKLCEYFGGTTITVPKIEELEEVIQSLLIYQYIEIDKMSFEEAVQASGQKTRDIRTIRKNYNKVKEVLERYKFGNDDS